MTPTLAQLQALHAQAGARPRALPVPPLDAMGRSPRQPDVHTLRQWLRLRDPAPATPASGAVDRSLPGTEIAPGLRLIEARLPSPAPSRIAGAFDRRDAIDTHRVLFFDTETTGLAGGTGTRAFLVAASAWNQQGLHIRQLLMTTLAAESALLGEFARWLAPDTILVSYNGKSYDAPLLRTRYRLARRADPLAGLAHVDLLYPTRRQYRGAFANCRLATIEREVLNIVRADDLPGSAAPAAWKTYLHGRASTSLKRVLAHNQQDVATLAQLLPHLSTHAATQATRKGKVGTRLGPVAAITTSAERPS
ncbi:MAG: exonuclease [Rhodanobacteraceae bacterium]|nr:MAG: exonuclease [Rhodanobacteraceae bacterium]